MEKGIMNAFSQIKTPEMAGKITAIVYLFRQEFPEAREDLRPWVQNSETEEFNDPHSIDLSFHFPPGKDCLRWALLIQIRVHQDPVEKMERVIGIEAMSYTYQRQCWRFSTIENWDFWGSLPPPPEQRARLRRVFQQILGLLNPPPESSGTPHDFQES